MIQFKFTYFNDSINVLSISGIGKNYVWTILYYEYTIK